MCAIEIENLTKRYGRVGAVNDLNLTVEPGSVFGFLGPNGAGKTTTIRLLLGFLRPSRGRAQVLGMHCWRDSHRIKAEVGYLPGDLRLYSWMTLRTGLRTVGNIRHRDLVKPGMELAERFRLDPGVRVEDMSRGMRQKMGLILALAHLPRLLLLDEPTASLDPLMQRSLYAYLNERVAAGTTVFFSSHSLSEVEGLCERVAILRAGKLVANERLEVLRQRARRAVTLVWRDPAELAAVTLPAFLQVEQRLERRVEASLEGPVSELIQWCSAQPLADIVISPPDLDKLFFRYYSDPEEPL